MVNRFVCLHRRASVSSRDRTRPASRDIASGMPRIARLGVTPRFAVYLRFRRSLSLDLPLRCRMPVHAAFQKGSTVTEDRTIKRVRRSGTAPMCSAQAPRRVRRRRSPSPAVREPCARPRRPSSGVRSGRDPGLGRRGALRVDARHRCADLGRQCRRRAGSRDRRRDRERPRLRQAARPRQRADPLRCGDEVAASRRGRRRVLSGAIFAAARRRRQRRSGSRTPAAGSPAPTASRRAPTASCASSTNGTSRKSSSPICRASIGLTGEMNRCHLTEVLEATLDEAVSAARLLRLHAGRDR